jgi:uncharacterized UBP type Zn finger protein
VTMATCTHLQSAADAPPSGTGCVECLATGGRWVHLRRCLECGHIGCCDSSPGKHATAHFHASQHPLIQSFEPREEWFFCYLDDFMFEVPDLPPSPAHP